MIHHGSADGLSDKPYHYTKRLGGGRGKKIKIKKKVWQGHHTGLILLWRHFKTHRIRSSDSRKSRIQPSLCVQLLFFFRCVKTVYGSVSSGTAREELLMGSKHKFGTCGRSEVVEERRRRKRRSGDDGDNRGRTCQLT